MAIGGFFPSRNSPNSTRSAKRDTVRRVLLEALEQRQLMTVGPQLIGIQPNSGTLIEGGEILNVSPRELVIRFDDAVGLDADTLSGIRVVQSDANGLFERASVATDFGTNGQTLVEFYAREPGEAGNGLQLVFSRVSRTDSRLPKVQVQGRTIQVELNSNPSLQTRVQDLLQVFSFDGQTAASQLVYALRLRGSDTIGIAQTVDTSRPYVLAGAGAAKGSTDFGLGPSVGVQFIARESGNAGLGIRINVTSRDRGGAGSPIVTVAGSTIQVEVNSNARFATTIQEFIDALNASDSLSSSLIEARLVSGSPAIRMGGQPTTYSPIVLGGLTETEIVPGYIGFGDTDREVVLRFAERLPQNRYRIDILGQGIRALRNTRGEVFNDGVSRSIQFELNLGARVQSVVPQPVFRNANGTLTQNRNQIDLYFNNDPLIDLNSIATVNGSSLTNLQQVRNPFFLQSSDTIVLKSGATFTPSVLRLDFYQLIHTAETLDTRDDFRFTPSAVRYFPGADRVTLVYSSNLEELRHPVTSAVLPAADLRLRVGTNDVAPLPPVQVDALAAEPGDTFATAMNLAGNWTPGAAGSQSVLIDSQVRNTTPFMLDFPGGSDEPGNRRNRHQDNLRLAADNIDGTSVLYYNFQGLLGRLGNNNFLNAITEQQKTRVREVFSLYERYLGVRFVETASKGLTVGVGDHRAITPFEDIAGSGFAGVVQANGPGGTYYEAGFLSNGQLGAVLDVQDFSNATLNEFGGAFQRAAMQAVGRMLGLGLADEVQGFTVMAFGSPFVPGVGNDIVLPGNVDIVHGRYLFRPDSKDIDLYRFTLPVAGRMSIETFAERMSEASLLDSTIRLYRQNAQGGWDEIAANDDYYSSDSLIQLDLQQGNYIVGVSASGNNTYDPAIGDSGIGGRSEGQYQLRMDFRPPAQSVLRDSTGLPIDGDSSGDANGIFNFWFRPSGPSNTLFVDKSVSGTGSGSLASPYKHIRLALEQAQPGDVVRIVGNGGIDGSLVTTADNLAYEIGFDNLGRPLPDGSTFDVPRGVTVMIDAAAILKMRRSRIGVGSTSTNVDRSGGSLLVLGTPKLVDSNGQVLTDAQGVPVAGSVYFTSANHSTLGRSANPSVVGSTPSPGDWGGIDIRNRVDQANPARVNNEAQGQFLNWVAHADIRFGGGQVVIDGVSQVVTPIQMVDSRPTIGNSVITRSADAAMSASPNSFLESNFHSPLEQSAASTPFSVDYDRSGPAIYYNRLTDNTINGLQVRIRTAGGPQLETMTIAGRWDDTDIVHYLPENLIIAGTPGGAVLKNEPPSSSGVSLQTQAAGSLTAGIYNYILTRIVDGVESSPSEPTASAFIFGSGSVVLANLPVGVNRIYRSSDDGSGPYTLVASFAGSNPSTFVDNGGSLGGILADNLDRFQSRLDARLSIDPGTIVKAQGSRIEASQGGQLIAEGVNGNPVVFTSLLDHRYGAGGTFRTASNTNPVAEGDWGGIYIGHDSKGSLDHTVVAFGGGTTRIEGGFSDFNAIEVHQGDLRVTNSRLENNASGSETSTDPQRSGRGWNSTGVLFVRGAQPVIANNILVNNQGPGISTDVNSLNHEVVSDWGRSRGGIDRVAAVDNRGPMIVGNRLSNNSINGMEVRGGVMTTEGVWDDTDIVHVLRQEIVLSDHNHFSGLRLTSRPRESLVVKSFGPQAGITATGIPLDNPDRIGGSLQVVGLPGYPVVLTSLEDCSVGAGWTPDGRHQTDTNNTGACRVLDDDDALFADIVVVMDESGSMLATQQFSVELVAQLDAALQAAGIGISRGGENRFGLVGFGASAEDPRSIPLGPNGQLFGSSVEYATAAANLEISGVIEDGYAGVNFVLDNYAFRPGAEKFIILATDEDRDVINPSFTFDSTLSRLRAADVSLQGILGVFVVDQALNEALAINSNNTVYLADGNGGFTTSPNGSIFFATGNTVEDYADLVFDTGGIAGDIFQIADGGATSDSFGKALISSIVAQAGGNPALPGDWRSVLLDARSNDRNLAVVSENESLISRTTGSNDSTFSSDFLGDLAPNEKGGDENQRLGFHIMGNISSPSDVDVYSFVGVAGSEVWLDIDRTDNSLDTVVELVDANGRTLALSLNSLAEEADPSLLYRAPELPAFSVNPLRKSPAEFTFSSAQGVPKDLYSTNPRDAGMRVVLPGDPGAKNLYHVRVRSSSLNPGDPTSNLLNPNSVGRGLTRGSYVLQMRLREVDEVPGSGIQYADIRFARNGLDLRGLPANSPLLGETGEVEVNASGVRNNTFGTAQPIGNVLQTARQALSVAGNIDSLTDVDWFTFDLRYERITPSGLREYFATVFDMDYADGIGRPDTSMYLFDSAGNIILAGLGSGHVDDQANPLSGANSSDLSRGSFGTRDPFLGSYELPVGTYFLAVTNSRMVPEVMGQFTDPNSPANRTRLQPIDSLQWIADDRVGAGSGIIAGDPVMPVLFDRNSSVVPYDFSDMVLYVSQNVGRSNGLEQTNVYMVNPFTGEIRNQFGRVVGDIQDIGMRENGTLHAFDRTVTANVPQNGDRDTFLNYYTIDPHTSAVTTAGAALATYSMNRAFDNTVDSNDGWNPEAIAFARLGDRERGFMVANRPTPFGLDPSYFSPPRFIPDGDPPLGFDRPGVRDFTNVIFEINPDDGQAFSFDSDPGFRKEGNARGFGPGSDVVERGRIETYTIDPITNAIVRQGTQLVGRDVTQVNPGTSPTRIIRDGDAFSLVDITNFVTRFEFDFGPEVLVRYNPAAGITVTDGMQFNLDGVIYEFDLGPGAPSVSPGATAIPLSPNATLNEFVDAIRLAMPSTVTVGYLGGRLNFSGAINGSFTQLVQAGVFVDLGSSGNVSSGSIPIRVLASDTAETVATRISRVINTSGIPGLSSTFSGAIVQLIGARIQNDGPLFTSGIAPGGIITGATIIGNRMYAVSDEGGLYFVDNPSIPRSGNVGTYVASSFELTGIQFTALVAGPANVNNGSLTQILFGLDNQGNIHAFDTAGRLQRVFANGATSVPTGLFNANGVAFSTLNRNLWHVTSRRGDDPGHGIEAARNNSNIAVAGGQSFYFGLEDDGRPNNLTYNFPGGASGALESLPISLAGISAGELPTFYFNYFLTTEAAASDLPTGSNANDYMRDSFRVYVSGEDGQWILTATNNDPVHGNSNRGSFDDELDGPLTGNPEVQRLFDNTGQWRQARVPLDLFAGQENVKIRIEFSTAGGFGYGLQGGRGPEIRTTPASRLVDGESMLINGQRFEIEMGASLILPSGQGIRSGDSITIDGTVYVFTDGAPVAAPDVAVPFSAAMTSEEVAEALRQAIIGNPPAVPVTSGLLYSNESNDWIGRAERTGITGDTIRVVGSGMIGDNPTLLDPTLDVDLVRIEVSRGATVRAEVQAASLGSGLDSFLRVFDSRGVPLRRADGSLVQNDNRPGSSDSLLTFVAPEDGTYFIGVSSSGNSSYNAAVPGTSSVGTSSGNYSLIVQVQRQLAPVVDGSRLQLTGARDVSVSAGSAVMLQGALGSSGVPVHLTADMTAEQVARQLQRALADFFAGGATGVYSIRGGDTLSLTGLVEYDSFNFITGQPEPSPLTFDSGPFGATTTFLGDRFSAFNTGTRFDGSTNDANPGPLQSRLNAFEGVYVDDFVIGLAGRGELVVGPTGGNTNFIVDPQLGVTNPRRDEVGEPDVLLGPYQFEIRGGEEYGIPLLPGFPQTILYDNTLPIGSRMSQGLAIQFNHSSSLVAGTIFVVSDGTRRVIFELDDVNDAVGTQPGNVALPFSTARVDPISGAVRADSAQVIAARFRDIINSTLVQSQLQGVTANLLNNDRIGATSDTVVLIGPASVEVPSSVGQTIVSQGRGGANRERLQGQVVINSTRVSNSLEFGATITTGPRAAGTNTSIAGTPRNTITINDQRLTPGAVIMNSEFLFNQSGGIRIEGDAGGVGLPAAAVPFVRLVNNTILGGTVEAPRNVTPSIHGSFVFETGSFAFADRVVSYNPLQSGGPAPIDGLNVPTNALGQPNYTGSGEPRANEGVVSLGRGGRLTLQFTDNLLTGSNSAAPDLVIFEVGDSEEVLVDVSADGVTWTNVGRASAASPAIDIDAFGFNSISRLPFVRLTDVLGQGSQSGASVGADIDAVGALSSVVVDQATPGGRGISVTNNATATLMNNVLVNNVAGIHVDSSSQSTVVGGSVFQLNVANATGAASVGQFPMLLGNNVPVFVNPGLGNLYPTQGSQLIDSSIDSLQDRAALVAVKGPLGYAASPILAPRFDINGSLRVDDPSVETPSGLGDNVFKDRGAQERGDFAGPSAILQFPVDNDSEGLDRNPEPNVAELIGVTPKYFDIRLLDGLEPSDPSSGSGIDHSSVTSASVLVYRDNQPLAEGVDYRFAYDTTNGTIRLQPLAGVWRGQSVYTIRLLNAKEVAVVARDASRYEDGDQFDVLDAAGSLTKFEFDLGYLVTVPSTNGIDAQLTDGQTFVLSDGLRSVTFEFDSNASVASGNKAVPLSAENTSLEDASRAIVTAISETLLQVQTTLLESGRFQILGSELVELDVLESGLVVAGRPGVQGVFGIEIPLQAGVPDGVNDGQTFVIDRSGSPVTFELDTNGTVQPGNVPVRFLPGASAQAIGAALVTAINGTGLGLSAAYVGNGVVRLGGDSNTRLDMANTVLAQVGLPGQPAAIAIQIAANAPASQIAEQIRQAVESAGLVGVTMTSFGNRLLLEGAQGASGVGAGLIAAIRDRAGNSLKPNQVDGTTTLTVFLGEGLDYGDAPAPWLSRRDDNGPRHTVVPGLSLGATVTADVDARLPDADQDDGVAFSSLFTAFQASAQVTLANSTGRQSYVSLWIDFDGDGFFANSEQIADGFAANTGTTTFSFVVPAAALRGETFARARLSTDREATRSPLGAAPDGEVEDWKIIVQTNPFTNASWNLDVNADGRVSSIDALQVINWLNDPTKPRDLSLVTPTFAPPFIDVNGDGRVSSLDALLVINFLNSRPPAGGGEGELSGEGESGDSGFASDSAIAISSPQSTFSSPVDYTGLFEQQMVLAKEWTSGLFINPARENNSAYKSFHGPAKTGAVNDLALAIDGEEFMHDVHAERKQQSGSADQWLVALEADSPSAGKLDSHEVDALLDELFPTV